MTTKVKNRKGSGDEKCTTCGSWLRHWENGTGKTASICGSADCNDKPVVGGHVLKVGGDGASYITPICTGCNGRSDEYHVHWDLYGASNRSKCRA